MKIGNMVFVLSLVLMVGFVSAAQSDCLESELYKPNTNKCVPRCTVAQDYVDGECLLKCRDLENHMWSVEDDKCVHICSVHPDFGYICDDYSGDDVAVDCEAEFCKGAFKIVSGRVLIERGLDIIPAVVGLELLPGDTVLVDDGARAVINFVNSGEVEIDEKTKFKIPVSEKVASEHPSFLTKFFGGIFVKLKSWFGGDEFEIVGSTDSGRRA